MSNNSALGLFAITAVAAVAALGAYEYYKVKRFDSAVDTFTAAVSETKKEYHKGHITRDVAIAQLKVSLAAVQVAAKKWADHKEVYTHLNTIYNLAFTHINSHTV